MEIPKFANESEEAAWWFDNQPAMLAMFEKAAAEGRLGHGTAKKEIAARKNQRKQEA
jgi:hypothetical protein